MSEISFSTKVYLKLLTAFSRVSDNWMVSTVSWLIDSKYRKYKRLDYFLKDQLTAPEPNLVEIAQQFSKYPYDARIIEVLKYVYGKIKYRLDSANFGMEEYWATAFETYEHGFDDCDGINGLIYVLARLSGIPAFKMFCSIGDTSSGGHFWVNYMSTNTDKMYSIDGTFYPDFRQLDSRQPFEIGNKYKEVWYMFNDEIILRPRQ